MRLVVNLAKKDLFKQTLANLLKMDQIQAHNSPDPPLTCNQDWTE